MSRFCNTCRTEKPTADFYQSYKTQCRACLKAKALKTRDEKRRYLAEWRRRNPGAHAAWYQKNKTRKRDYWKKWREANKEHCRAEYRRWAKANPDRINALIAKRTAARIKATPSWANHDAIRAIYREALRLTRETGVRHEVDHVVPLRSSVVCGLHVEANLQILTSAANKAKSNQLHAAQSSIPACSAPRSSDFANCVTTSFEVGP